MTDSQPTPPTIGQIIDRLGVTSDGMRDEAMITDVVLIAKTASLEGDAESTIFIAISPGMSWIEKRGMIEIARDDVRQPVTVDDD